MAYRDHILVFGQEVKNPGHGYKIRKFACRKSSELAVKKFNAVVPAALQHCRWKFVQGDKGGWAKHQLEHEFQSTVARPKASRSYHLMPIDGRQQIQPYSSTAQPWCGPAEGTNHIDVDNNNREAGCCSLPLPLGDERSNISSTNLPLSCMKVTRRAE